VSKNQLKGFDRGNLLERDTPQRDRLLRWALLYLQKRGGSDWDSARRGDRTKTAENSAVQSSKRGKIVGGRKVAQAGSETATCHCSGGGVVWEGRILSLNE